jgi:uncharacterized protein (TIGR02594 family)
MICRRDVLLATPFCAAGAVERGAIPRAAIAQSLAKSLEEFGFVGPADDPEFGPAIKSSGGGVNLVGSAASRPDEVATAFRLLFAAPRDGSRLDVASYFENIKQKNRDGELYNYEWSLRANPLIVGLFSMTNTLSADGDQTPWCAAFVNFCLYVANRPATFSALSGSFRRYGTATADPKPGDIVVFSKWGEGGRQGYGHVGFFVEYDGDAIRVLGGNQRGSTGSTGAVTTGSFPRESAALVLHSIRSVT